jgi:hypothetical protein
MKALIDSIGRESPGKGNIDHIFFRWDPPQWKITGKKSFHTGDFSSPAIGKNPYFPDDFGILIALAGLDFRQRLRPAVSTSGNFFFAFMTGLLLIDFSQFYGTCARARLNDS